MADILVRLKKATRQLFPTGRATGMIEGGVTEAFNEGLIKSENEVYLFDVGILDSLLPDNDNFTVEDADIWEIRLGIPFNPDATFADRKAAILRKLSHPGDILARQHYLYIEGQLQKSDFDVYCHEYPGGALPAAAILGTTQHGNFRLGQALHAQDTFNIVANYSDEESDKYFTVNDLQGAFFVGGAVYPNTANVPIERKIEFRELILRLKPAQTPVYLLINYT